MYYYDFMSKIITILIVIAILVAGILFFNQKQTLAPTISESMPVNATMSPIGSPTPTAVFGQTVHVIKYLSDGKMDINSLNIKIGDKVNFINNDSAPHWPASGMHPTHLICSGFNALNGLASGESYSHTFTEAKTCPFHDHLNAGNSVLRGQIIVHP